MCYFDIDNVNINQTFIHISITIEKKCDEFSLVRCGIQATRSHHVTVYQDVSSWLPPKGAEVYRNKSPLSSRHRLGCIPPIVCVGCPKMLRGKLSRLIFLTSFSLNNHHLSLLTASMHSSSSVGNEGRASFSSPVTIFKQILPFGIVVRHKV